MRSFPQTPPSQRHDEKNLVADQPGRVVLFGGVILSLIIGLSIRGVTAPGKVKSMVETAASKIHKDVRVDFEGASLSFSRGLLPRFAVIIQKVHMESSNPCWMTPELLADEIRLPLSFWGLVRGENPITQVEAGIVEIRLRSAYKNCEEAPPEPRKETPRLRQFVTLKSAAEAGAKSEAPPPQVEAILIDQLKIAAPPLDTPLDLSAFAIRLKSNSPRVIEMTARTHLIRDAQVGDYLSHATVWAEYTEFPKKSLQARLSGNWREGSYELKANYLLAEEDLSSELDLKHIPMNQAFQMFKKMHWLNADLNARQVWVSLNAQLKAKQGDLKSADMRVRDLRLEGDLGDVSSPEVRLTSLDPVKCAPFTVDIQRLSLEKLLALAGRPHPSSALGQLGYFSGTVQVHDPERIEVAGTHRGMEFIFSNKGQREVQTLKEIAGKMTLQNGRWTVDVARFVPDQGAFDGDLQMQADRDFKNIDIKARAKNLQFAPRVVGLMTAGGSVGAFNGDVQLKFQEGGLSFIKGILNSDSIDVEGVRLEKSRLQVDYVRGEIVSQAQVQKLQLRVGSPGFQIMKDLIEPAWMENNQLGLRNLTSQFRFKDMKALSWKGFQAGLERGGRVTSDGQWDADGELTGTVQTPAMGKGAQRWILSGRRDQPAFTLADASKKKKQ
jgi:hypothetical protein